MVIHINNPTATAKGYSSGYEPIGCKRKRSSSQVLSSKDPQHIINQIYSKKKCSIQPVRGESHSLGKSKLATILILQFLNISEVGMVTQTNRNINNCAKVIYAIWANQWGYEGREITGAIRHIQYLYKEIDLIAQKELSNCIYYKENKSRSFKWRIINWLVSPYVINHELTLKKIRFEPQINTLLSLCAKNSLKKMVKLLLIYNANPNHVEPNGDTPLHWSTYNGDVESSTILLNYGAYVNQPGEEGRSALAEAVLAVNFGTNHIQVMELLLNHRAKPDMHNIYGKTCLHEAVRRGYPLAVKLLLDNGAGPNKKTIIGTTPLGFACNYDNEKGFRSNIGIVRLLLDANADQYLPGGADGRIPLQIAQYNGFENISELLLQRMC